MSDNKRSAQYKKDERSEDIFAAMNAQLKPLEEELIANFTSPQLPIVFVVGAQRSGTTLLMQLLTEQFNIAYPNNFISRYWDCPYIGASLYKSFNFGTHESDLTSDLGYTGGLHGPHEFGYFWKRWFPWEHFGMFDYESVDYNLFKKELAAWQSIGDKPLFFKNLIQVSHHIKKLLEILPNAFFLYIEREDFYTIQSTYFSRLKLFGNTNEWLGVKPRNYSDISKVLNPLEQITQQVLAVKQDFMEQFDNVSANRVIRLNYEEFVEQPKYWLEQIRDKFGLRDWWCDHFMAPSNLESGNRLRLDEVDASFVQNLLTSSLKFRNTE